MKLGERSGGREESGILITRAEFRSATDCFFLAERWASVQWVVCTEGKRDIAAVVREDLRFNQLPILLACNKE